MTAPRPTLVAPLGERRVRADARRNLERILEAARASFAEEGAEAQMEAIARRAGVGIGTLYRNFPTKQALVAEMIRQRVVERTETAGEALEIADPWESVTALIYRSAQAMARDAGLRDVLGRPAEEICQRELAQYRRRVAELLRRAQRADVVRRDVTVDDLQALLCGLAAAIARGGRWRRYSDVILEGLRAR